MTKIRSAGIVTVVALAVCFFLGCNAPGATTDGTVFNVDAKQLALRGYDAVAYVTKGSPTLGKEAFQLRWSGAVWYFESAANRDAFEKEPAKYAPQYGGFCAWATAQGYKANADPRHWKVVNGKLYVNYDKSVHDKWLKDVPGFVQKADKNWPEVQRKK